jgi:hypothetical protein
MDIPTFGCIICSEEAYEAFTHERGNHVATRRN